MCACRNRNGNGESRAQRPNARHRRIGNAGRAVAAILPSGPLRKRALLRACRRPRAREHRALRLSGPEENSGNSSTVPKRRTRETGWVGPMLFSVRASAIRHAGSLYICSTRPRETGLTKIKNFADGGHVLPDRMTFLTDCLHLGESPIAFPVLESKKYLCSR